MIEFIRDIALLYVIFQAIWFTYELMRYLIAGVGFQVLRVSFGLGEAIFSFEYRGSFFSLNAIPLFGSVVVLRGRDEHGEPVIDYSGVEGTVLGLADDELRIHRRDKEHAKEHLAKGETEDSAPALLRLALFSSGAVGTFLVMWLTIFVAYYYSFIELKGPGKEMVVGYVAQSSPAYEAGLRPNDQLVALNGHPVSDWREVSEHFEAHLGKTVTLGVVGAEGVNAISYTPRPNSYRGYSDFTPKMGVRAMRASEAAWLSNGTILSSVQMFYDFVIPTAHADSGLIGSGWLCPSMVDTPATRFYFDLLVLITSIQFITLFLNLLPLPCCDGGRILRLLGVGMLRSLVGARRARAGGILGSFAAVPQNYTRKEV